MMGQHDGYFLYHSIGQFPQKAKLLNQAFSEFSEIWSGAGDAQWPRSENLQETYLKKWEELINAPPETIIHTESVTSAVHALITSLPSEVLKGKRVVAPADSFPSILFLLQGLEERYGYNLDIVPIAEHSHWVECDDISSALGDDVGLLMLNWVSSTSSHKTNIARLASEARAHGAIVGLDATQGVGILPFDVQTLELDFVATTSLKWVCGIPGAGILYVDTNLTQRCFPERRGWFSQENPFNWDIYKFKYADDVRRFQLSTPSVLGCVGTLPALDWLFKGGAELMRNQNLKITTDIIEIADEIGIELCTPREEKLRGGSVMLKLPAHVEPTQFITTLREKNIFADARGNILRLSPGVLTNATTLVVLRDCLAAALHP